VQPRYPSRAEGPQSAPPGQGVYKVGAPYQVNGIWYVPKEQPDYDQTGVASWYGDEFHEKATANGEVFDMNAVTGAHTTLPLPSMVEVTNLDNGKKLYVRVNDRGPFVGDRIIDLSHEAARELGYDRQGLARVRVKYVGPAPLVGPAAGYRVASNKPLPTRLPAGAAATGAAMAATTPRDASSAPTSAIGAPVQLAAAAAPAVPKTVASATAVSSQALPPLTGSAISSAPIGVAPGAKTTVTQFATPEPGDVAPPTVTASIPAATAGAPNLTASLPIKGALRIQAGAYSSQANAQRAVSQLASVGPATIEPMQREGGTLYRVVMPAPADEAEAYAVRDKVAGIGFADARVLPSSF